jgi:hypothetical protein
VSTLVMSFSHFCAVGCCSLGTRQSAGTRTYHKQVVVVCHNTRECPISILRFLSFTFLNDISKIFCFFWGQLLYFLRLLWYYLIIGICALILKLLTLPLLEYSTSDRQETYKNVTIFERPPRIKELIVDRSL